jgi:Transcriptional regulator, AbiEi antitoxin
MSLPTHRDIQTALETFRQHGGVMRTRQTLMRGIHPAALYRLVEDGQFLRLARGLYRLTTTQEFSNPEDGSTCPPGEICGHGRTIEHGRRQRGCRVQGRSGGGMSKRPARNSIKRSGAA